jgi:predicted ATPase
MKFKTETNWCAITGAPSSGKTAVIDELARRGYQTEPEIARELIEAGLKHGQKLQEIRAQSLWLQNEILRLKLLREQAQDPQALIFLDRGLPDSVTYFRTAGLDLSAPREACMEFHYRHVFIFDRLAVVQDGIRTESDALAHQIDLALEQDYRDLGYTPIRVPVIPIPERADFILQAIEKNKP